MPEVSLLAEPGRAPGSRVAGRLRREGKVPAVIYGHGIEPIPVAVDGRALRSALSTEAGHNALLTLQVGGGTHLALTRELQRDPVRGTVAHVDFLVVRRDEVVTADVNVTVVGEATELLAADGVLDQELFTIPVSAAADRIPSHIDVDVSGLHVGESIRVADLVLPSGVTTDLDPEEAVFVGTGSSVSAEAAEIEAADAAVAELQSAEDQEAEAAEAGGTDAAGGDDGTGGGGTGGGEGAQEGAEGAAGPAGD